MHTLEAFDNKELLPSINEGAAKIMLQLDGANYAAGLAALFTAFLTVCHQADLHPGVEFEYALATFEARSVATHGAALNQ